MPGSYPRSKMISEVGVITGGFFINMESLRLMVNAEFRTITPGKRIRKIIVQDSYLS